METMGRGCFSWEGAVESSEWYFPDLEDGTRKGMENRNLQPFFKIGKGRS